MYTYTVGVSQNAHEVYISIVNSVAGRFFNSQPHLMRIAKDMLAQLKLTDRSMTLYHNMGRVIGNTNIVATSEKDTIFYANPHKRSNILRFVKNRSLDPSSELVMVLIRDSQNNYEIMNAWVGPLCPPFPDAVDATEDSKSYWESHALVAGSETIDTTTITRTWPY